ncbi:MAG: thiamine pyrophosphate-dependent enzyme [Chitinophagales bacterium]|nr:thiamine pyrophosphate-dependent enzyme [Chitinophagales bacterium]MDW8427478.1 thiamine pyrophosphate-dependent enzyme [Chitinophagales bacterium]
MNTQLLLRAYELMCCVKYMAQTYDENRSICKYVHSTSRGHEAIQLAVGLQLRPYDYIGMYYRDESILLALGFTPYELMLQLIGKRDDPFSGGREYYAHPSFRSDGAKPTILHHSSATGMQAIPLTGAAQGVQYLERKGLLQAPEPPVVVCSMGDGSVTEGEVSEAWQFAVLKQLPILYLVQDNGWSISVSREEMRAMDAYEYAGGFKGLHRMQVDGSDFVASFACVQEAIAYVRRQRRPVLVHATVPLLNHHTSGVRKEMYRSAEELAEAAQRDPLPKLRSYLIYQLGIVEEILDEIDAQARARVAADFNRAVAAADPDPATVMDFEFVPTPIIEERGTRTPSNGQRVMMVDAALHAVEEILRKHPEAIFFGQDVGRRLGGVFREAATLAEKFGDDRVFNTAIQEAYIVGSTAGLSAVGVKPIVEIQFADYQFPALNQLITEISKSCYLTLGKFPVNMVLRIPIGAYGGGGPYHSGCHESVILPQRGLKVCYPSNAADLKGLLKAAFYDPNPVIVYEHKGLYWCKNPGTEEARTIEPDEDYVIPLGKARIALAADEHRIAEGFSLVVVTYGMGVYWAMHAARQFPGCVEIIDLRTLYPLDEPLIEARVRQHGKCLVLTEETVTNSFAQALSGRIAATCFQYLDAPVCCLGALPVPAIPLNMTLEQAILPSVEKVAAAIDQLLHY